jgi:glycerol-3-phosphate dehydrogenase
MYAVPWEGATLIGTTDLDHTLPLAQEPCITRAEGAYLLQAINHSFPDAALTAADVLATQAGVRAVVGSGKANPSKESRDEYLLADRRLVTICGGKLTTYAMMARKALRAAGRWIAPRSANPPPPLDPCAEADDPARVRLWGRYGQHAAGVLALAPHQGLEPVLGTRFVWAELRWAARNEQVLHLDDLLLRRTRLGLLLPDGGEAIFPRLQQTVQSDLGWDPQRWAMELKRYRRLWREACSPALLAGDG